MRILTAAQMKQAEAAAVQAGTAYEQLMENAGAAAADFIEQLAAQQALAHSALLLCGRGNNAGDAFVVARLLAVKNWDIALLALFEEGYSPLASLNRGRLPPGVRFLQQIHGQNPPAFVIDGVFGTGFKGALPPVVARTFAKVNQMEATRVALDVPSGLDCDTGQADADTFAAAYTVAFGALKPALAMERVVGLYGRVAVADIGL